MNIPLKKKISIIVGGAGQFGITLANQLIKKKYFVLITTRNTKKTKKKLNIKNKNIKIINLNILKISQIEKLLSKYSPDIIFYFAGLSSPNLSFKKPKSDPGKIATLFLFNKSEHISDEVLNLLFKNSGIK